MEILPGVRRKLMRKRTEKILDSEAVKAVDPVELSVVCHELSIEGFIGRKLDYFFSRLGSLEADGLYDAVIEQVEKALIQKALKWAKGNQLKAARVLGVNRNTLRTKMRKLKVKKK